MAMDPMTSPELRLGTVAEVTGAWATIDPSVASAVEEFHIGMAAFLDNRLKWRRGQALTVLELRAYRLSKPLVVVPLPEHFGCFSWGELSSSHLNRLRCCPGSCKDVCMSRAIHTSRSSLAVVVKALPQNGFEALHSSEALCV